MDEPKILYICDRHRCEPGTCSYPECRFTTDITHAVNFEKDGMGNYVEKEKKVHVKLVMPRRKKVSKKGECR